MHGFHGPVAQEILQNTPKLVEFARVDRAMEVCRDALWEPYLVNQRLRIVKLMNAWLRTRHWIPLPQQYIATFR